MSLIAEKNGWFFVDEEIFINRTYLNTVAIDFHKTSFLDQVCNPCMFDINDQFLKDSQHSKCVTTSKSTHKKRKLSKPSESENNELENYLQSCLNDAITTLAKQGHSIEYKGDGSNNQAARTLQVAVNKLQELMKGYVCRNDEEEDCHSCDIVDVTKSLNPSWSKISGHLISNSHHYPVLKNMLSSGFLFPPSSTFLMSDITRMGPLLDADVLFDCVVLDPPWQNKSVKRKRMYNSMPMFDLKMLPIRNLCAAGCLVVVWVTNKRKLKEFIIEELFPMWKVSFQAVWYWLKVTKTLCPVLPLSSTTGSKKPYETLILGQYFEPNSNKQDLIEFSQNKTIISIPSAIHSHKPPLIEVLRKYLPNDPKCLELFARNLLPGWYSWGDEVLLLQNETFFNKRLAQPHNVIKRVDTHLKNSTEDDGRGLEENN